MLCITGASGVVYGVRLAEVLREKGYAVSCVITENAALIAKHEVGMNLREKLQEIGCKVYLDNDLAADIASSSVPVDACVVAPCSLKTLAAIASGFADNLVARSAINALRMRRPLILVVRETPLSLVDLENMVRAARAGAVILPACPAFYHKPRSVKDMVDFVVGKVLDVLGIEHSLYRRWEGLL